MPVSQADIREMPPEPCWHENGCCKGCMYWGHGYSINNNCGGAGCFAILTRIAFCIPCLMFTDCCCHPKVDEHADDVHDQHEENASQL